MLKRIGLKLREAYTSLGATGAIVFNDSFLHLDRSINEGNFEADRWTFKRFLAAPGSGAAALSDLEMDTLFAECVRQSQETPVAVDCLVSSGAMSAVPTARDLYDDTVSEAVSDIAFSSRRRSVSASHRSVSHATTSGPPPPCLDPNAVADLAVALVLMRKLIGRRTQQVHDAMKRLRSKFKVAAATDRTVKGSDAGRARRGSRHNDDADPIVDEGQFQGKSRSELYELFTRRCGLTPSEAFLVLESALDDETEPTTSQRRRGDDDNDGGDDGYDDEDDDDGGERPPSVMGEADYTVAARMAFCKIDVDYLAQALLTENPPDDILFPLLLQKVVDAMTDTAKEYTGTVGMLRALGVPAPTGPSPTSGRRAAGLSQRGGGAGGSRRRGTAASIAESGAGDEQGTPALWSAITESSSPVLGGGGTAGMGDADFRAFTSKFGCGLSAGEANQLFDFLADAATGRLDPRTMLTLLHNRLPVLAPTDFASTVATMRHHLVASNLVSSLNALHFELFLHEDRLIPLADFTAAVRQAGVAISMVPDVLVEYVHREAPTCVAAVLLLRGPMRDNREGLLRQLFDKLDGDCDGLISRADLINTFAPDLAGHRIAPHPQERVDDLKRYVDETLPAGDTHLSFAEFVYYWGNASLSFADDSAFTLYMWRAFGMQRDGIGSTAPPTANALANRGNPTIHTANSAMGSEVGSPTPRHLSISRRRVVPSPAVDDPARAAGRPSKRRTVGHGTPSFE